MTIPDSESLMRPLLALASDRKERSLEEAREKLALEFGLTKDDLNALSPKGQPVFKNRVAFSKVHLQAAGILDSPTKSVIKISDRGREVLKNGPKRITYEYLKQFPEYALLRSTRKKQEEPEPSVTPDEEALTAKVEHKADKQYWAGGFQWGDTNKHEEFIQGNFWQIGWKKKDKKPAAKKTWAHFEQVNIGDEFAIKGYGGRNDLRVRYVGEVIDKTDDGILKLRKINRPLYRDKGPKGLKGASWFDTLVPIKSKPIIDAIFYGKQPQSSDVNDEPNVKSKKDSSAMNLILYGPPGTGKTYHVIERAVQVIDPESSGDDHVTLKRKYNEMTIEGRIKFITFHQSYSYEDFVEGIRPVLDTEEEGDVPRYECRAGIFKQLAVNALFECLGTDESAKQIVPFDVLWKALLLRIDSDTDVKYPGLTEKASYQLLVTPRGNIEGINVVSDKHFLCSRKILEKVFDAKRSQDSVTSSEVMEVVMRGCHSHLVAAIFNELRRIEKSQFRGGINLQVQTIYTDEERAEIVQRFLSEGEKSGYQLKPKPQGNRKHVLIIDEINRGNISKILGELITLIEVDKRLGKENGLVVTLPYSGDKFAVPANLYLLATMNTADKSIALVDLALRRRFEFEELRVDLTVCDRLTDDMRSALEELNRRITLRKDRDHQIGHAYFIDVGDEVSFNRRFRTKIIPLLQEYFNNDWEGLRYILGEKENSESSFIRKISGADAREARTKWQWFFDASTNPLHCLRILKSNYQPI